MSDQVADDAIGEAITAVAGRLADLDGILHADTGGDQLLAALEVLRDIRIQAAAIEAPLIAEARAAGVSWARLAPALGVTSRQAAERRYLRLNPTPDGDVTAEGRVRAVRDHRAGERATTAWARSNAAELRLLAGQVSITSGLTGAAHDHAAALGDALGNDDPAALLPLLETASPHVRESHPRLAERIDAVTATVKDRRTAATDERATAQTRSAKGDR